MIHLESKIIIQQFNSRDPQNILIFNHREANPEFIFGPMGWTVPNQSKMSLDFLGFWIKNFNI